MNVDRLLRLYPRRWRARYEDEMRALLNDTGVTPVVVFDLLRGAGREWIRTVVRPPTAPIDLKHGRRRNFAIVVGTGVIVWTLCVLLTEPLRHALYGIWDSNWKILLMAPYLAPMCRAIHVAVRRNKIRERARSAALPLPEDEISAAGVGRIEYWILLFVFTFGRTCMRVDEDHAAFHEFVDFYMMCFSLYILRTTTRTAYARKLQVDGLARQLKLTRLNL